MTSIAITNTRSVHWALPDGRVPLVIAGIGFVLVGGRTSGWWRRKPKRSTRIRPSSRPGWWL